MKLGQLNNTGLKLSDKMNFGPYTNLTVKDVCRCDSNYIHYCIDNIKGFTMAREVYSVLPADTRNYPTDTKAHNN